MHCYQGFLNKKKKLIEICDKINVSVNEVAYIGDGLVDIPVFEEVGLPISVPNAHFYAKEKTVYTTKLFGGNGAFYEVVELILKEQGIYEQVINKMKKDVF